MKTINSTKFTHIIAEEGYKLYDGNSVCKEAYIPITRSVEDYQEITDEEAEKIEAEKASEPVNEE